MFVMFLLMLIFVKTLPKWEMWKKHSRTNSYEGPPIYAQNQRLCLSASKSNKEEIPLSFFEFGELKVWKCDNKITWS